MTASISIRRPLKNMSFGSALDLAIGRSGMTRDDVAERMGWSPSHASRVFNTADNYWPNPTALPRLCAVLGNRDLLDWLEVHYAEQCKGCGMASKPLDELTLLLLINEICAEMGDVHLAVQEALEGDHAIQPAEAKTIIRQSYDVLLRFDSLVAGMSQIREEE